MDVGIGRQEEGDQEWELEVVRRFGKKDGSQLGQTERVTEIVRDRLKKLST